MHGSLAWGYDWRRLKLMDVGERVLLVSWLVGSKDFVDESQGLVERCWMREDFEVESRNWLCWRKKGDRSLIRSVWVLGDQMSDDKSLCDAVHRYSRDGGVNWLWSLQSWTYFSSSKPYEERNTPRWGTVISPRIEDTQETRRMNGRWRLPCLADAERACRQYVY